MGKRDARKKDLVEATSAQILATGLPGANLRPLAAAVGTSDRMLLYYFGSKAALLEAVLERIAAQLAGMLDAALPPGARLPTGALQAAVWAGVGSPDLAPYTRIWLELAAAAARGEEPHRRIGGKIADFFHDWLCERIDAAPADRNRAASALLVRIEGALLLQSLGRPEMAAAGLA